MIRWCVTGGNGLLGSKLLGLAPESIQWLSLDLQEHSYTGLKGDYIQADITSRSGILSLFRHFKPQVVFHTAAFTHVDGCEIHRDDAWAVNVAGAENVARACFACDAKMIHLSTDYVFDGREGPYSEEAVPRPLSFYGLTKLESEKRVRAVCSDSIIARTMVLYGYAPHVRSNFALWLLDQFRKRENVRVVTDQMGNPTLADDLARGLITLAGANFRGLIHTAGREWVSRYEFARKLAEQFDLEDSMIQGITTRELNLPANRPLMSGLNTDKMAKWGIRFLPLESALRSMRLQMPDQKARIRLNKNSVRSRGIQS